MVGKSTLYKWLHQDNRADMRFYLDMVKHSLDYLKGEKVGSQACFLVLTYTYYRVVRCLKSGSLTTTKKSRNKDYFNKELLFYLLLEQYYKLYYFCNVNQLEPMSYR